MSTMPGYAKLMIAYGLFLLVAGLLGWGVTGFTARGATAIGSGAVTGTLMLIMGWLSAQRGPTARKIGIHMGLVLALAFAAVFTWRGLVGWGILGSGAPKPAVAALISTMALVSYATFGLLLTMRPGKADRV